MSRHAEFSVARELVAQRFHLAVSDLHPSAGRRQPLPSARGQLVWVLRELGWRWTEIGERCGYRDHHSALHHYGKVQANPSARRDANAVRLQVLAETSAADRHLASMTDAVHQLAELHQGVQPRAQRVAQLRGFAAALMDLAERLEHPGTPSPEVSSAPKEEAAPSGT